MLVDRESENRALDNAWRHVLEGQGKILLLTGDAGMGKTALLEDFRERLSEECDVFWGGCDALATPRVLGPIHDMVTRFRPSLSRRIEEGTDPYALFSALLLELEDRERPAGFVIEDIHWADIATLDLLKFLGRRIGRLNVLLVMSFRDEEVGPTHPLHQVLGDLPHSDIVRVRLSPLTLNGITTLLDGEGNDAQHLFDVTQGNPFFVTELIAGVEDSQEHMPASVREAVYARMNRLEPTQRDLLDQASIFPRPVEEELLLAYLEPACHDALQPCLDDFVLERDERGFIRFRHELARLAILERLAASQQQHMHVRALAQLQASELEPSVDWLVHHADGAHDGEVILDLAPIAGRQAAELGAHKEAAAHFATALQYVDQADTEQAAQLYQDWAYEAGLALRIDDEVLEARRHAVSLWRAVGRAKKVGENLRWLSRLHWYRGESSKANHFANEAVKVLEEAGPSAECAMAYSLRSQLHMLGSRMEEAIEWGERALAMADRFDNDEVRIHALNNVATAQCFLGHEGGVEKYEQSLALALLHNAHEHAARVYTNLTEHLIEFRRFPEAEKYVAEGIAFDTEHDLDSWTHYLMGRKAQLRLDQGKLSEAQEIAERVLGLRQPTLLMRLPALTVLATVRMRMADKEAKGLLANLLTQAIGTDEFQYVVPARIALIEHAWLRNQQSDAAIQIAELCKHEPYTMHRWHRGEICVWAKRFGLEKMTAKLNYALAEPHLYELSGENLEAAVSWQQAGAPYHSALALTQRAMENDAKSLAHAASIFSSLGAKGALERLRDLARQKGVPLRMPRGRRGPYRSSRDHPFGLTEKEQEVLRNLRTGASNAEIALRMSRSPRTIEHHVSSIIAKCGVRNRTEAIAVTAGSDVAQNQTGEN